ncbi:MAG: hypothetical protein WDW38_010270 [Sanguina aurantia]
MQAESDFVFKILLIGDSGVGKSCLLNRFTSDRFDESTTSTIGVDFKVRRITCNGQVCKLTVWDTAGQERFRTLTSSYYRGAQGIVYVYDVTRRETFEDLAGVWMKEVEMYSTVDDLIQMVVANKVDLAIQRQVTSAEGHEFARTHGCLFVETSAKANIAVEQTFEELVLKILDTPSLVESSGYGAKGGLRLKASGEAGDGAGGCSC